MLASVTVGATLSTVSVVVSAVVVALPALSVAVTETVPVVSVAARLFTVVLPDQMPAVLVSVTVWPKTLAVTVSMSALSSPVAELSHCTAMVSPIM